jgi:hypothetical protein
MILHRQLMAAATTNNRECDCASNDKERSGLRIKRRENRFLSVLY